MATSVLSETTPLARADPLRIGMRWQRMAMGGLLALYALSISTGWFTEADSALYLMLGGNLASGEGFTLWGIPHATVPPGYPAFLAGLLTLGLNDVFWLNLVNVVMALALLGLVYRYVEQQVSANFAFLVCLVLGFSHEMHTAAMLLMSETLFMLTVWLGIYCYGRGLKQAGPWLELGTLALIACCWVRVAGFPLAGAAAAGLVLHRCAPEIRRPRVWLNAAVLLGCVVLTAAGFYLYHQRIASMYTVHTYGGYVQGIAARSDWQSLTRPLMNLLDTSRGVLRLLTGQQHNAIGLWGTVWIWLPIGVGMVVAWRRGQRLGVCCTLGYIGSLVISQPLMARYLLPLAPWLIWYLFDGVQALVRCVPSRWRLAQPRVAMALVIGLRAINLPHSIGYAYYAHRPEAYSRYATWRDIDAAAAFLKRHAEPGDRLVASSKQRQLSYLSGLWSARSSDAHFYCSPPPVEVYQRWRDHGLAFIVAWTDGLTPECNEPLRQACTELGFQLVYSNGSCKIYSIRPSDQLARSPGITAR